MRIARTRMRHDRRGVAALEMALVCPMILLLCLGGFDLTLWIRAALRLDEAASGMGEVISQCKAIDDPGDIAQFRTSAQALAGGTDITSQSGGAFIVSAVGTNAAGQLVVLWQRASGNPAYASHIGAAGAAAALGAYVPPQGEVLIATELFAGIQPWRLSAGFIVPSPMPPLYSSGLFLVRSASAGQLATLTAAAAGITGCTS